MRPFPFAVHGGRRKKKKEIQKRNSACFVVAEHPGGLSRFLRSAFKASKAGPEVLVIQNSCLFRFWTSFSSLPPRLVVVATALLVSLSTLCRIVYISIVKIDVERMNTS